MAVLLLTMLPGLIGAYNYLRGMSSPIDQVILALLGSDLSRLMVLASCIIGAIIGLYLSRFVTAKLDVLKKERGAKLSKGLYVFIVFWWMIPVLPITTISLLEMIVYGFPTSHFLSELGYFVMAGYFLTFSIPVLLKYGILLRYALSIDSKIILVEHHSGRGFNRRFQDLTLRVVHEGPNP
jgi:hypothetical protein